MPKQMTEEEQLRLLEQLDPSPASTPLPAFTEEGRPLPPATGAPRKAMTEEEQLQYLEQLDPTPGAAPQGWLPVTELPSHLGDSAKKLFGGMIQAITHPGESLDALHDAGEGAILNMLTPEVRAMILKDNPNLQARIDTANAVGEDYANRYGLKPGSGVEGVARSTWNSFITDPFAVAADATTVPGVGGLAAGVAAKGLGAAGTAAAVPVRATANALNKVSDVVNPLNLVTAPVEWVGKKTGIGDKIGNVTRNALDSFVVPQDVGILPPRFKGAPGPSAVAKNKAVLELAENPNALAAQLKSVTLPIPDSRTTAGKSGVEAPRVASASELAEKLYPEKFRAVRKDENDSRLADLRGSVYELTPEQITRAGGVDPSNATIAELEAALRTADSHNYGPIDPRMVSADDRMLELLSRPSGDIVLKIAEEIAKEEGGIFRVGESIPAHTIPDPRNARLPDHGPWNQYFEPFPDIQVPARYAQYRGEDLIRIKKAYNRLASNMELRAKHSIDDEAAQKIANTGNEFVRWMEAEGRLPEHRTAAEDHATISRLIDRKRAMGMFEDVLTGHLEGEDAAIHRAAAFTNLFDSPKNAVQGNSAVKKATDFSAYNSWADLLTADDLARLERVKADLARLADARQQAKDGVLYGQKIAKSAEGVADGQVPNMLNNLITTINAGLRGLRGDIDKENLMEIAKNLVDGPEATANMFDDAIFRKAQVDRFINHLNRIGRAGKRVAPGATNMLNAEREHRNRYIP